MNSTPIFKTSSVMNADHLTQAELRPLSRRKPLPGLSVAPTTSTASRVPREAAKMPEPQGHQASASSSVP